MKAISLWQPWASAMALGSKRIETRHWPTKVRGRVAIHAAKRCNEIEMIHYQCSWNWAGALNFRMGAGNLAKTLPFGSIVAVAELVDCRHVESFTLAELETLRLQPGETSYTYGWTERQMGNYKLGRFGWVFENIQPLATPIPFTGRQGFFHVPDDLFAETMP